MCHWVLRVWQCGDSFFTKYSSCSFDRAANDPTNLLNPLHPSITALGSDKVASPSRSSKCAKAGSRGGRKAKLNRKSRHVTSSSVPAEPALSRSIMSTIDDTSPARTQMASVSNSEKTSNSRDARTGEAIPILPLSEIGKASRFGDKTLGENSKCNVFEVVLQTKEQTMCPACARSPRRARLPAHARGCFGLS